MLTILKNECIVCSITKTSEVTKMSELYDRQETLDLNTDQKILVCGIGGIGWHVVKGLAMAGVNDIVMFDDDIVEIHNLPRLDIPMEFLGKNKATLLRTFINQMRPDNNIVAFPFKSNFDVCDYVSEYDVLIDCTDNHESQLRHQEYAKENGLKYMKVGYNGNHITISNSVAEWDTGDTPDGYTITPSFISPAIIVAGLAINIILTEQDKEISVDINNLYN